MRRVWLIPAVVAVVASACSGSARGAGDADQGGDEQQTGQVERTPTGGAHDTLMDERVAPGAPGAAAGAGAQPAGGAGEAGGAGAQVLGLMYASDNLEVQTSQTALQHAQSAAVKRLAQRIAHDHQTHRQRVEQVSQQAGLEAVPPANAVAEQTQAQDRLAGKTGAAFDSAYVALQVEAHQKAIADLERMQGQVQNQEVRQLVDTTLSTMRAHLQEAQRVQRTLRG